MSPIQLRKYILNGSILRDLPAPGYASHHHLGRNLLLQRH